MEVHPGLKSLFHFKHFFANRHLKTHFSVYTVLRVWKVMHKHVLIDNAKKMKSYFLEVSIKDQLENLFRRPNFVNLITRRFTRTCNFSYIKDIYGGDIYKRFSRKK